MIYLDAFSVPRNDLKALEDDRESRRTCYGSRYPFGVFLNHELPRFTFEPVTVLCGGNGSGKTTLLNLMGECLDLQRSAPFNRSSFYSRYLKLCQAETTAAFTRPVRAVSRVITSDDVFDSLLDLRSLNDRLDEKRRELLSEYKEKRYAHMRLRSLDELDRRPVESCPWTEVPNVRAFYGFFHEHQNEFEA